MFPIRLAELIVSYWVIGIAVVMVTGLVLAVVAALLSPWTSLVRDMWIEFRKPYEPSPWLARHLEKESASPGKSRSAAFRGRRRR